MLTVGAVHPFELLCNPSSRNVWFLWRSLVRDDPSGPDHFASTCLFSIDHLEYLHLFDVFLLFSFGLIDQSYRNVSFLGVVSHLWFGLTRIHSWRIGHNDNVPKQMHLQLLLQRRTVTEQGRRNKCLQRTVYRNSGIFEAMVR